MNEGDVDAVLNTFFAGCLEYDIFELARIWGVFSNSDIQFFKDVLGGKYEYPATMTWEKQQTIKKIVGTVWLKIWK